MTYEIHASMDPTFVPPSASMNPHAAPRPRPAHVISDDNLERVEVRRVSRFGYYVDSFYRDTWISMERGPHLFRWSAERAARRMLAEARHVPETRVVGYSREAETARTRELAAEYGLPMPEVPQ